jgi:hypothetical protein
MLPLGVVKRQPQLIMQAAAVEAVVLVELVVSAAEEIVGLQGRQTRVAAVAATPL